MEKIKKSDIELIEKNTYEIIEERSYKKINVSFSENSGEVWLESGEDKYEPYYKGSRMISCELCNKKFLFTHIEKIINHLHTAHQL